MFSVAEYTGRPAAWICICFVLGAACYIDMSAAPALLMVAAAPLVGALADGADRRGFRKSAAILGICCVAAGAMGYVRMYCRDSADIAMMHALDGCEIAGTAIVADAGDGSVLLDIIGADRPRRGKASLTGELPEDAVPGDTVSFSGSCSLYSGAANPGEFSYMNYMKARGQYFRIDGVAKKEQVGTGGFTAGLRSAFYRASYSIREWVRCRIEMLFGDASGVVKGFLTGDTSDIRKESMETYRRAGIGHIFAVSGMHVTILANAASLALMAFGVGSRGRKAAAGISALLLLVICGFTPSAVRAARMLVIGWVAERLRRRSDGITTICLSAAVSMAVSPHIVYDPGFVMSHCILLSFTVVYGRLAAPVINSGGSGVPRIKGNAVFGEKGNSAGRAAKALSVIAAPVIFWATAIPVSVSFYGTATRWGWLVSILCLPLFPVMIISALLALAVGSVWVAPGAAIAGITRLAISVLDAVCGFFGTKEATISASPMPLWFWTALLLMIIGVRMDGVRIAGKGGAAMAGMLFGTVTVGAAVLLVSAVTRPAVQATFLSVGQGDACVVRFSGGQVMVVDAGPEQSSDTLLEYCRRQRIDRIDVLVLSHGHIDHGGGMRALMEAMPVSGLYLSGPEDAELASELETVAAERGTRVFRLWAGDGFEVGGSQVRVLWPDPCGEALWRDNRNDYSLVMRMETGKCGFIFTGDIESDAESLIMKSVCPCDVLKVPHHGSAGAGSAEWAGALSPGVAVISVGRNNYGHPSAQVLDWLRDAGSRTLITVRDGAAVIACDGTECLVSEWKGPWGLKN